MSHAEFLRPEWIGADKAFLDYIRTLWALGGHWHASADVDALLEQLDADMQELNGQDRAIVHFSIKLTCAPGMMTSNTMQPMLNAGMTEQEAYDVVMVNAMFAFMNRLADGTGVTLTEARTSLAEELLGERVVEQHLAWGSRTEP